MTQKERAAAVGTHVMSKIIPLQRGYLEGRSAAARAQLAQLRRLDASRGSSWMAAGELLFSAWPEDALGSPESNAEAVNAVQAALMLYAVHQQSETRGVALVRDSRDGSSKDWGAGSFGRVCRDIEPDLEAAKGVQRRLSQIEAAKDFDGVTRGVRGLVQLMKAADVGPLDYWQLARDLYLVQLRYERDGVMRRWARQYYAYRPNGREE